jgi:hypothetical protein
MLSKGFVSSAWSPAGFFLDIAYYCYATSNCEWLKEAFVINHFKVLISLGIFFVPESFFSAS